MSHTPARILAISIAIAIALPVAIPVTAFAQIEEIVVTARKKEENLKDIPLAIEAISADDIQRKGLTDLSRLAEQSASLKFDQGSARGDTRLSIRGLSPTRGRQNAAILVDGIDISSESISTSGGSILVNQRLLAVERIDIVKGPQSALWGRSAFNGAINFVTKDPPEEFAGSLSADVNAENQYLASGDIGGPIFGEKLAVIVNGAWWNKDGFYDNSVTGDTVGKDDGYGFSVKTKSDFGNGLTVEARVSYEHYEEGQSPEAYLGFNKVLQEPAGAFVVNNDPRLPAPAPALFCLPDTLSGITPGNLINPQLLNQTLLDRYARQSLDPNNPALGDGPHCQQLVPVFAGAVPDGDKLKVQLATNPFSPGQDYPGIDGNTVRYSLVGEWALDKGSFTSLTGYTDDDNSEAIDFSRYAIRDTSNPFLDDNVNTFQSNNDKTTTQFQEDLRYTTNLDGAINMTIGGTYWEEKISNESKSLTMQSNGSYCFYSASQLNDINAGNFAVNPPCPGYTELPVQYFVGDIGQTFGDGSPYHGIEQYTRDSPIDRSTEHRSFYGLMDVKLTDLTTLTLEGRYSHEDLKVHGPVFYSTIATGGPGSWSICGVPGRACQVENLPPLPNVTGYNYLFRAPGVISGDTVGGPFWNQTNFQNTYDVWQGIWRTTGSGHFAGTKNTALFNIDPATGGQLNSACANDPNLLAREAAVNAEIAAAAREGRAAVDPQFDLFNPFCVGQLTRTDDWFAPKITLSRKFTPDILVYGYWGRSEKPGGFALFTVGASGLREDLSAYDPEKMDTWELGTKATTLDGTLYLEGALFYNDYTDKQVLVQGLGPDGRAVSKIDNAPAEVLGAELSAQWRPETTFLGGNWTLSGAYLYVDGEYKNYTDTATSENNIALSGNCTPATLKETVIVTNPLTGEGTAQNLFRAACAISFDGNKLERAPKNTLITNVNYTIPVGETMESYAELASQYRSKQYIEYTNESWLDPYWNFDLRVGLRSDRWEVIGYVENLLDDDSIRSASNQPGLGCCFALGVAVDLSSQLGSLGSTAEVPNARAAFLTPPRLIGLRANWKFGAGK